MTIVKETKYNNCWVTIWRKENSSALKKLKIELPYDPAVLLLNIYSKEMKTERNIPMLTSALFTTAYAFKQPMACS